MSSLRADVDSSGSPPVRSIVEVSHPADSRAILYAAATAHEAMRSTKRAVVTPYIVAVFCVAVAAWARMALAPWLGDHSPFTTFIVAAMVSATYGGFAPGVAATFLGALAAILFFSPPQAQIPGEGTEYLVSLVLYLVGGLVLALLCESLRAAKRHSEIHAARAVARQAQLEAEMAQRTDAEKRNTELLREVQEANHRKDDLLAMLAHELRNPLAPIRNAVGVMRYLEMQDERLRWSRDVIERQVAHLARLVDDLLDVSRLMRGMIRLQTREIELATFISDAVEASRPLIDARGHQLAVSFPAERIILQGDPTRLAQVLGNLLDNAAKYTDAGGHIVLRAERLGDEVVIRVRDDGRGMSGALLPHVFELFMQGERSLARTEGGLGIGLTLTKSLIELHGGQIEALSDGPGKGSEFVVRLPATAAPAPANNPSRNGKGDGAMAHSHRILVVDDKPDAADSLALLLRVTGHEVRTAYSGAAALDVARQFAPDIAFLDLGMPGMDGFELARRLRKEPEQADALLVALTGYNQEDDLRRCRDAGFDTHLSKPAQLDVLQDLLHEWDSRHRKAPCETR
jgi:signal transduction histidine kinase/CheY-like chemotaxis protein